MVLFWFLLALVLLVAALVTLRLDAKQRRGGGAHGPQPRSGQGPERSPGNGEEGDLADADAGAGSGTDDDDETPHPTPPADTPAAAAETADRAVEKPAEQAVDEPGAPMLAPFQRGADAGAGAGAGARAADGDAADAGFAADAAADDEALAAAASSGSYPAVPEQRDEDGQSARSGRPGPAAESSPRLLDRVRALLPARRTNGKTVDPVAPAPVDPLAGSPVVRWLEDREFAPTPTPAPEFLHGDFAGGLSALGTVSHGVFRGRRAIMGVTGGRTVLALRRDTASDVVLDLSRPDVDAEPGFHDAGEVGLLEARTSDYGRLDLIDRDRLIESVRDVPADVRRIWAEGEWVAATIDGVDDPGTWDDVVMALHAAADVLAPFPPIGGRARALPAEMDPGAPGAAEGPEADPTMGMDGEVGTGTHGAAPMPDPEDFVVVDTTTAPDTTAPGADAAWTPSNAPTASLPAVGAAPAAPGAQPASQARRSGHLRLVPDRPGARALTDAPVTADRGDATEESEGPKPAATGTGPVGTEPAGTGPVGTEPADSTDTEAKAASADGAAAESVVEESDPFAEIMEPSAPVEARGDVAADHLEPRPPLSRPTRGVGQAYPEDATVPPLAAGAATGGAGIKPLGSEDDEDEIRDEVERFDAARIDGGSDLDEGAGGRHGAPRRAAGRHGVDDDVDPSEVTQRFSVAELAARMGVDPAEMRSAGRRRRRAEADDDAEGAGKADSGEAEGAGKADSGEAERGRERPGIEPDVEQTTRIVLPPDIRD